ncbi:MAG: hypothetical protein WCI53_12725 [Bacteroidota bacterium]
MKTKKPQIPSLQTVKEGIDKLILIEKWDNYKIKSSPKKFEKRLNELFIGNLKLMIYPVYLSNDKSLPKKYYRLRKQSNTFNEKLISEYSYPPNHFVKTIQRANIPYHPVFYCSDNPSTAIMETVKGEERLNSECVYYMSEWETKSDQEIRICPFIFDNVSEKNPYRHLSEINRTKLFDLLKEHSDDEKNSMFEIMKFLSNLFTFDNTYVVSSYLAYINLYANHNFRPDIFIYPSIQNKRDTVNFAIHPNAVVEKLTLKRVFKLRLTSFNESTSDFTISIVWVGQNNNGIIQWQQVDPDTEKGRRVINELDVLFKAS